MRLDGAHTLDYDPINNVFLFISTRSDPTATYKKHTWAYKYGTGTLPQTPVPTVDITANPASITYG